MRDFRGRDGERFDRILLLLVLGALCVWGLGAVVHLHAHSLLGQSQGLGYSSSASVGLLGGSGLGGPEGRPNITSSARAVSPRLEGLGTRQSGQVRALSQHARVARCQMFRDYAVLWAEIAKEPNHAALAAQYQRLGFGAPDKAFSSANVARFCAFTRR
jgi:hypothetical protein